MQGPFEAEFVGSDENRLVIADGSLDALVVALDLDGDGTASTPGELSFLFDDGGNLLSSPSGIVGQIRPFAGLYRTCAVT